MREYLHSLVTVFKLSFDEDKYEEIVDAINRTNTYLFEQNTYLSKYHDYNPTVPLTKEWEEICTFEIEEKTNLSNSLCVIHQGIKGVYPLKKIESPKFALINMKPTLIDEADWDGQSKVSEDVFDLAVLALEEMGLELDERYIEY